MSDRLKRRRVYLDREILLAEKRLEALRVHRALTHHDQYPTHRAPDLLTNELALRDVDAVTGDWG